MESNYSLEQIDICDKDTLKKIINRVNPDKVFHFAAESHVDNSILAPDEFIQSNIIGTFNLLEAIRDSGGDTKLIHVSTDEVYGSLGNTGAFAEDFQYSPNSPYSATKAGSDHLVRAWHKTYGLNTLITNCSNNFGPNQHTEKFIPKIITQIIKGEKVPLYGSGANVRDWLFVKDHVEVLYRLSGIDNTRGKKFNIGGGIEKSNFDLILEIHGILCERGIVTGQAHDYIEFVADRAGHDFRYAIDDSALRDFLLNRPTTSFKDAINMTIDYYIG
jgi:dTDP-glucose 4,6-dehydratase